MSDTIEFKYVIWDEYNEFWAYARFTCHHLPDGSWENETLILNDYGDEPDACVDHGWHGEIENIAVDVERVPLDFKTMDVYIRNALGWYQDLHVTSYRPDEWEFDGMGMVRAA